MKPVKDTFRELVRRQVFRAAGAYVVVSWLLVQVASIILPEFGAPSWAMRALIIMLIAGFPFAMLIAWTVDWSSQGIVRTADSQFSQRSGTAVRVGLVTVAALISGGVLWWVWSDLVEPTTQRTQRPEIKIDPVVAVHSPVRLSGSAEIEWLGDGIANLIRNELAESRRAIVLSQSRWSALAGDASSTGELVAAARDAGIDYLVGGEYLQTPSGIVVSLWVEDVENGNVVVGSSVDAENPAGVIALSTELVMRIKQALNIPLHDNVNQYAADFAVANIAAYEAYIAGLGFLSRFDYEEAEESLRAALAIAPDFHMARYRLATVLEATGRTQLAMEELESIPEDAQLTERERLYIEGVKSTIAANRDPARGVEIYREIVDKYPYDMEGGQLLADAYWLNYQDDKAVDVFRRLADVHAYDPAAWMALGERLLDVGELDQAEDALRRYAEMAPEDPYAASLLGNLAQLRGDYGESVDHYDRALELRSDFAVALLGRGRSLYLLEDRETAVQALASLVDAEGLAPRFRIDAAFDLTGILRGLGRFEESRRPLEKVDQLIRDEGVFTVPMLSSRGVSAMEAGDYEQAADLIAQAVDMATANAAVVPPARFLFARGLLEIRTDRFEDVHETAAAIESYALDADNPDRTEEKAAVYLRGLAALRGGEPEAAEANLRRAVGLEGRSYALYTAGLAEALFIMGMADEAAGLAEQSVHHRDPGRLDLDLELDRTRARLLYARILAELGRVEEAKAEARQFLSLWSAADEARPELATARNLVRGGV